MRRVLLVFAALLLYPPVRPSWAEEQALATKVEHFFVVSDQAKSLFTYFKDEFQLPEIWPFSQYGVFASGGLSLGNAALEFVSFRTEDNKPLKTEFRGIAFEPTADADTTAAELTKRKIPHSGVQPYKVQVSGREQVLWANVMLANFHPTTATIFFCDYKKREAVARGRKTASDELDKRKGGTLGIVALREITVGVQNLKQAQSQWRALLRPSPQLSDDVFVFNSGPQIRIVYAESPGIQRIVLTVRSIGEAERFLKQRQLLIKGDAGHIAIIPAAIGGLVIQLGEK